MKNDCSAHVNIVAARKNMMLFVFVYVCIVLLVG